MNEDLPVVVVTNMEYEKARHVYDGAPGVRCVTSEPGDQPVAEAIARHNARGAILGTQPYFEDAIYDALPRGAVIARFGVGHDGIDKAKATARGILVTNTPGALTDSVAELTMWLMGALARHLPQANADMHNGTWKVRIGKELRGKTLAIVGCGVIGSAVAKIAAHGMNMRVVAFDCRVLPEEMQPSLGIVRATTSFADAVKQADFVSVHLSSTPETERFINAERIGKIKHGACLINMARGAVLDEVALFDALVSGHLAGAALDVFATEPYVPADPDKDLRSLPNVVMTPHLGSSTLEACERIAQRAVDNVCAGIEKRYSDMNVVNPDVLDQLA